MSSFLLSSVDSIEHAPWLYLSFTTRTHTPPPVRSHWRETFNSISVHFGRYSVLKAFGGRSAIISSFQVAKTSEDIEFIWRCTLHEGRREVWERYVWACLVCFLSLGFHFPAGKVAFCSSRWCVCLHIMCFLHQIIVSPFTALYCLYLKQNQTPVLVRMLS